MLQWTRRCRYFFEIVILFPLDVYPDVRLLDHMAFLFLGFWGTYHNGCTNLHSYRHCTDSLFSTPSTTLVILSLFGNSYPSKCEVISYFDLHFPDDWSCWASFHVPVWPSVCVYSLGKCLLEFFGHFFIGLFVCLLLTFMSCLYILDINPYQINSLQKNPKAPTKAFLSEDGCLIIIGGVYGIEQGPPLPWSCWCHSEGLFLDFKFLGCGGGRERGLPSWSNHHIFLPMSPPPRRGPSSSLLSSYTGH